MSLCCKLVCLIAICFIGSYASAEKIAAFNQNVCLRPGEVWAAGMEGNGQEKETVREFICVDEKLCTIPFTVSVYEENGKISLKTEIGEIKNGGFSVKKRIPDEIFPGTVKVKSNTILSRFEEPSEKNKLTFLVEYLVVINYFLEVPQSGTYADAQFWKLSIRYRNSENFTYVQDSISFVRQKQTRREREIQKNMRMMPPDDL